MTPSNEDYFISSNGHNPPKPNIFKLKPEPKPIIHSFTGEKVGPSGLLVDITKSVVDSIEKGVEGFKNVVDSVKPKKSEGTLHR